MLLSAVVEVLRAIESAGHSLPMIGISSRLRLRERSRAHRRPGVAPVVAAVQRVARPVEARRRVRADDVGRVPVRAVAAAGRAGRAAGLRRRRAGLRRRRLRRSAGHARRCRRLRRPGRRATAAGGSSCETPVRTSKRRDVAVLRRGVDDVRVLGVVARLEAVAAGDDEPVARAHAPAVTSCARGRSATSCPACRRRRCRTASRCRPTPGRTARSGRFAKKRQRRALVVRLVEPAVVGEQHVAAVGRVERQVVMVDVDVHAVAAVVLPVRALPGLAAVRAALDVHVHRVDRVGPVRIDEDLVVVLRAAAAIPVVGRRPRPARAAGCRAAARGLRCGAAAAAAGAAAARRAGAGAGRRRRRAAAAGVAAARRLVRRRAGSRPACRCAPTSCRRHRTGRSPIRRAWRPRSRTASPASCARRSPGPTRPMSPVGRPPWSVSSTSCRRWSS